MIKEGFIVDEEGVVEGEDSEDSMVDGGGIDRRQIVRDNLRRLD